MHSTLYLLVLSLTQVFGVHPHSFVISKSDVHHRVNNFTDAVLHLIERIAALSNNGAGMNDDNFMLMLHVSKLADKLESRLDGLSNDQKAKISKHVTQFENFVLEETEKLKTLMKGPELRQKLPILLKETTDMAKIAIEGLIKIVGKA